MEKPVVVIPSFRRFVKLKETLNALTDQTMSPALVIVVDDGSDDGSDAEKKKFLETYPLPNKFISQKNAGASAATNHGVREAGDVLVILFDDDIIPDRDTIERHAQHHSENPGSMLSGAADTDPARVTSDVERYKLAMEAEWKSIRKDATQKIKVGFENFITTTANLSMRARDFLRIGGFDESLRDGYDVEFGLRALEQGIPAWFDGSLHTIHNDSITLRYYARRQKAYADAKKIIFSRHPELRQKMQHQVPAKPGWFKRLIYSLLRRPALVNFTESSRVMMWLPKKLRYRIYGSTIAALSTDA